MCARTMVKRMLGRSLHRLRLCCGRTMFAPTVTHLQKVKEKHRRKICGAMARLVRKPGSVVDGHLSRMHVAVHLKPPVGTIGQIIVPVGVAADRVYRPPMLPWDVVSSYLAFPPLPFKKRRYISVALFLRSPSADVIRYPCPVQPGLSSCPKARDRLHQS